MATAKTQSFSLRVLALTGFKSKYKDSASKTGKGAIVYFRVLYYYGTMKKTELAWQAGIIDGEGCLTLAKQIRKGRPSPAYRPMVTVSNTDRRLIAPFCESWGGTLYKRPDSRKQLDWADSWTWYCPRSAVSPFLRAILPHLRGKAEQAKVLIKFVERCKTFPRSKGNAVPNKRGGSKPLGDAELKFRDEVWNAIRRLNTKGQFSRRGGDANAEL